MDRITERYVDCFFKYLTIALMIIVGSLTSCSYKIECPSYGHNRKTMHGEKAQAHYAKKHKKILYLLF